MESNKKRILSAIQPTGNIHLGNYLGAVHNWVNLQENYHCTYGVVDYHSMTMPYDPVKLRENTWSMVCQLLACGVHQENLFIQSMIPEHTELAWILSCVCSHGELSRMTQFKDKTDQLAEKDKDSLVSAGLFFYPVLQAADILMYHADFVPVGKDQEQHLELGRNIAQRFNHLFNKEYFVHPAILFTETPKILSLADPNKKMSKSLGDKHYVNIFGDENMIRKQVKSAVTDTGETNSSVMSPGVKNLFEILKACQKPEAYQSLMNDYEQGQLKYSALKEVVAEGLIDLLKPISEKYKEINANKKAIKDATKESSSVIRERAKQTLREVREITGLPGLK